MDDDLGTPEGRNRAAHAAFRELLPGAAQHGYLSVLTTACGDTAATLMEQAYAEGRRSADRLIPLLAAGSGLAAAAARLGARGGGNPGYNSFPHYLRGALDAYQQAAQTIQEGAALTADSHAPPTRALDQ